MPTASPTLQASTNGRQFTEKLCELRSLISDIAKSAPAAAKESFEELRTKATSLCDSAECKTTNAAEAVVKKVKEHPTQLALAAIGAGLLAWWLLSRKHK